MSIKKFFAIGLEDPSEFIISWNLGNTCNWKCVYCPKYLNDGSVYWTDNELIKKTLLRIKEKITSQKIRVEFMGGEVTLKPDFIDLLQFCKDQGLYTHIVTNASRTVEFWERLAPVLDTAILTFHPDIQTKIHYESIIDTCIKYQVRPSCHLSMTKEKFWEMTEYKKYLESKYIGQINVDFIVLFDKENKFNYNGYFFDYDIEQIKHLSSHGNKNYMVELDNGERIPLSINEVKELGYNRLTGYTCGTKIATLNIDYRGGASISVCAQRNPVNIYHSDIANLLEPRVCQQDECRNPSDLRIVKVKE